jgi:hypothetical protein
MPIICLRNNYNKMDPAKKVPTPPGLCKHDTRPISFTLVFDDFGIKYTRKENAQHILDNVQQFYKCLCDWDGERYCGLTKWDYNGQKGYHHQLIGGLVGKFPFF